MLRCALLEVVDASAPWTRDGVIKYRPAGSRTVHEHSLNALLAARVRMGRRAGALEVALRGRISGHFFRGPPHGVLGGPHDELVRFSRG